MTRTFADLGLPDGFKGLALAYHEPTGLLIVHTGPIESVLPRGRLAFRGPSDTRYYPVADFPDSISIETFVLHASKPSLYFLTMSWKELESPRGRAAAGDWDALYRFDLEEHRCQPLARRRDLVPAEGYEKAWLCELFSVSTDGRALLCKAGLQTARQAGRCHVDYWVTKIDLTSMEMEPVTKLEGIFA